MVYFRERRSKFLRALGFKVWSMCGKSRALICLLPKDCVGPAAGRSGSFGLIDALRGASFVDYHAMSRDNHSVLKEDHCQETP